MAATGLDIKTAEQYGVDLDRARRAGVQRLVLQAVRLASDLKRVSLDSPVADRIFDRYDALTTKIGYDPIP